MHLRRLIIDPIMKKIMFFMMVVAMAPCVSGQVLQNIPVNVFGDGEPLNGVEDSREPVFGGQGHGLGAGGQYLNSGTIKCNGKIRGTAMVVDTGAHTSDLQGVVIITAAHVVFDLDKKRRFKRCEFNFLGMNELASYRARIDLKTARMGGFDPRMETSGEDFGEGDWVFLHIPKPWKNFNPHGVISLREFADTQTEPFQQGGGEFRLIAFDSDTRLISVSGHCTVVESAADDLGGGAWKGQLLDDCDSKGGASGGGIVAIKSDKLYLVGIRTGSHWSELYFPASEYAAGPPDGAIWDRHKNTNFGRAIDARLIRELAAFVESLKSKYSRF